MSAIRFEQLLPAVGRRLRRLLPRLVRWCAAGIVLFVLLLITLRFINPPMTALILLRSIEYGVSGRDVPRQWSWRSIDEIPTHVQRAVVTSEDARFMEHWGVDLSSAIDAFQNTRSTRPPRGASTITMQTVKNLFLWPGRSYIRKGIEVLIAPVLELLWGKRRILEVYLNVIEFGEGIYGIEAAARHHYRKSAAGLSPYEAASLAAILPSPRRITPRSLPFVARRRLERVLREGHTSAVP